MKVIFTLIISIVLCLIASIDLNSQTQGRTLSLDEVTTSGQYIARDWIEMQRGFSFTATSPTAMEPKKAKLIWFLTDDKDLGWQPYLNLNAEQVVGSGITGTVNIYTLYATVLDLSNQLKNIFTTSAGWSINANYNSSDSSAYLEITHPSNFVLSLDYNYEDYEIDDYVPATDGTFTAMIDKNLILDAPYLSEQPNINRELDFSLPVGTIPGMFDVSATGAATYSIPIEVPPGTMGMQPQLAVVYNSQGGNGLLGMGFDLSGLSVISRTNKTWYSNNSVSGITFTRDDIFTLDGNKLVLISENETYGSPNSVYATENETFSRITAYGIEGNGPEWFKVETKDGKTLEYGKEENARLSPSGISTVLAWRLNKVSDANGNYVRFFYRNEEHESVISRIEYTGNDTESLEPYNTIEFLYAVKEDSRKAYIGGRYISQSLLLESIRVNYEDDLIKEYLFSYTHDVYSHLSEIKLRNGDNERLNSTIFNWGEYNKSVDVADISIPADLFTDVSLPDRYWNSGDVNGDGIEDLISLFAYDGPLYPNPVNIVKTFNGQESPDGSLLFDDDGSFYLCPHTIPVNNYVRGISSLVMCDLNGDSKHDIVLPYFEDCELGKRIIFYVANGQYPQGIFQQDLGSNVSEMPLYGIRDLNNDGIDDIIYLEKDEISQGSNQYQVKTCYRNTVWQNNEWSSFNLALPGKPERLYISDFNADGLNDIMVVTAERSVIFKNVNGAIYNTLAISLGTIINTSYGIELGDFNGDGLMDFLCNKNDEWYIAYNNGDFTYRKTALPQITTEISTERKNDKDFLIVNDFNNDGRSDFVIGDYHLFFMYHSLITTWYASNVHGSWDIDSTAAFLNTNHDTKRLVNGDFNGDGRAEIVYYGNLLYGNVSQNIGWRSYSSFNENFEEGLLKEVSDGFGRNTKVRYLPLTNSHTPENAIFYDRDDYAIYPVKIMNGPLYCLWKLVNEFNDDVKDSTEYAYGQGKVHAKGAGFLGFMSTSATNSVLNSKTIVENEFENTYYHLQQKSVLIKTASGTSLKRADTDYGIRNWQGRYFSYLNAETKHDFLNNSTSISRFVYQPDATGNFFTGNVLCDSTDYGDGFIKKNEYKDFVSAGSYTANMPTLVVVTQKHPNDQQTYKSKIHSSYNPANGHLLETVENYECPGKEVTTTYSDFNTYGQSGKITLAAPGIAPKNAYYDYDTRGRFLVEVRDTLGTVSYSNNPILGKTISVTGINGKTAYSCYDNWGVLEKSITADSISTYYKTGWAEGNGPENALYYSYTQPEGQPWLKTWYDAKGRLLREESIGFNNIGINTDYTYTPKDEVDLKTTFMGGIVTAQVDYEYYDDGRLQSETYLGGKVVSYQYDGNTVAVTTDNKTYSKTYDKWGNVTNVVEPSPGGQITYNYYSNGKPSQIISPSSTISMAYDAIGNQTMLADPDAGTIQYGYDALDRLIFQSDNKGNVDSVHYDYAGRIDYKKNNNEKTSYEYIVSGNGIGQLRKVTAPNGSYEQYDYDEFGRTVKTTKHIDNSIDDIIFEYSFNEMGQTDDVVYPGSFTVSHNYDNFGNLVSVKNGSTTIWELNQQTASKLKYFLGNNGMYTEKNFDANGFMTSCITKIGNNELQNRHYAFNPVNGLLTSRSDERITLGLYEAFDYDDLYRLTNWDVTRNNQTINYSQTYKLDESGNIGYKSGTGYYDYADNRPHVMDSLTTVAGSPTLNDQIVTYTGFNKVYTITENDSVLTLTYGPDQQRIKSELTDGGTPVKTWYYGGLYEKEIKAGGATRELLYIPAGDGLAAVYIRNSATGDSLFFLHTDHLGSIVSITDAAGNIKEEYSYDPWGRRRDPLTWELAYNPAPERLTRGFTGHEHLDVFGLINMNGRVYDPMLGLFLSPDNYIQAPDFSQNFNRYAYCFNNPLAYTDPSGDYIPVFAFPTIGWSKEGGLSVGVTVGIGVPGIVSLQLSGEYAFKSNDYSITIGASVMYNTAYLSYSGSNGWSYGFSMGLTPGNSPISSSFSSAGFSWNLSNEYATFNFSAWNYSEGNGWSFNPGFSIAPAYYSRNKNGESSSSYFGRGIVERMKARRSLVQNATYLAENEGIRPDADGYITFSEANDWYRNGGGNPLFVETSQLDLGGMSAQNFPDGPGSSIVYNLLMKSFSLNDGLVHGKVVFTLYETVSLGVKSYYVMAKPELYDFDYKSWGRIKNWLRNGETFIGSVVAGKGDPYVMRYFGRQYIPYKTSIFGNTWVK